MKAVEKLTNEVHKPPLKMLEQSLLIEKKVGLLGYKCKFLAKLIACFQSDVIL